MPIHLLPPWWRPFCSAMRFFSVSSSLSRPPIASICFFSSSVRYFSASFFSHSAGNFGRERLLHQFEALEHVAEHAVELVEVALVLHQRGARQIVEVLDAAAGEIGLHRLHQREVFAQRHRHAGGLQLMEEGDEHGVHPDSCRHDPTDCRRGQDVVPAEPMQRIARIGAFVRGDRLAARRPRSGTAFRSCNTTPAAISRAGTRARWSRAARPSTGCSSTCSRSPISGRPSSSRPH